MICLNGIRRKGFSVKVECCLPLSTSKGQLRSTCCSSLINLERPIGDEVKRISLPNFWSFSDEEEEYELRNVNDDKILRKGQQMYSLTARCLNWDLTMFCYDLNCSNEPARNLRLILWLNIWKDLFQFILFFSSWFDVVGTFATLKLSHALASY